MFQRIITLAAGLLLFGAMAAAQTVKGTVLDPNGDPVPGAYVIPDGVTANGTITDLDGCFTVEAKNTVSVSFIGFLTQDVQIAGRSELTVVLKEDSTLLEETVVIGYGSVRKSDLTGAVSSVGGSVLEDKAAANVGQLLQGRMSGVYIVDSGNPQNNVSIKIRGLGTVNNSNPLLVLDGVPMVNMSLNSLNAEDIETIDVLKDASATAIYGSRGANGVIIVTTKKGSEGEGVVRATVSQGVAMATSMPELLDAAGFAALNNDMMSASENALNPLWTDPSSLGKGTDWLAEMISPAHLQAYSLSYSGGNDKNTYYVSGSYTDHDGIVRSVGYKKATMQINLDNQVKKWLKFSTAVTFSYDKKTNGDYSMSDVLKSVPVIPVKNEDGTYAGPAGSALWYGGIVNQVGKSEVNTNCTEGYNFIASETVEISILKGLKFRSVNSIGGTFVYGESFRPAYDWKPNPQASTERYQSTNRNFSYLSDNYFSYDLELDSGHRINAMAGMGLQWGESRWFNGQMKGFLSDNASQFDNGTEIEKLNGSRSEWAIASFFGRVNWSWKDRYMLTATVRYDGSSKFGPANRWGLFPSFAAAWRISEEPWFPKNEYLTYAKLRAGYGITGNQEIGDYTFASVYDTGQYSFNGNVVNSLIANKLSNDKIRWEEVEQYNVGVDFSFFSSRLRLSLDGYIKNTNGMLVPMSVPISSGYSDEDVPYTNQGRIRNTGLEITLGSDNIVRNDFYWGSDFNISFNKNRILSLSDKDEVFYNDSGFGQNFCVNRVGEPIGAFIGWKTNGIFQTQDDVDNWAAQVGAEPGDIRFADEHSDGEINEKDRTIIGYSQPVFTASFNNTIRWKGFDAEIYFQGVYGNTIFNVTKVDMTSMNTICNQYAVVKDRWTGEGTSNTMPRAVYADPNNNTRPSDRYLEDGSYLRLKNLTLGYTLPASLTKKICISSLRFFFSANNLFTLTSYSGFDPEVGEASIDWGTYPITRTFSLGVDLKF